MREIDLIPPEHQQWRHLKRWLERCALTLAAIVLGMALGRAAMAWRLASERPALEQSRQAEQHAAAQRARLVELEARKVELDSRLAALREMQANSGWELALRSIDAASGPRVWLDRLAFGRVAPDAAAATPNATAEARHVMTAVAPAPQLVEVKGHAMDHAAVTEFMRRLTEQPGVRGVRLVDTGLRRYSMADVVDFSVSARLAPATQERP
jgi:hypothetical protein